MKNLFGASLLFVFALFGSLLGCGSDFEDPGYCQSAPQHLEVREFNGAFTNTKLMLAIRQQSGTTYLEGYTFSDPTKGEGVYRALEKEPTDCAPLDLTISAYSGDLQILSSDEMELLRVNKASAELVWTAEHNGNAPSLETYFTEEWQDFLLDLVDCSPYARGGAQCLIKQQVPANTVGKLGDYKNGQLSEATMLFLVWRTQ